MNGQRYPMKPLSPPNVPGKAEFERFDSTMRRVLGVPKEELLKRESQKQKARKPEETEETHEKNWIAESLWRRLKLSPCRQFAQWGGKRDALRVRSRQRPCLRYKMLRHDQIAPWPDSLLSRLPAAACGGARGQRNRAGSLCPCARSEL